MLNMCVQIPTNFSRDPSELWVLHLLCVCLCVGADSGHSTLRDNQDPDSEYEPNSIDEEPTYLPRARKRNRLVRRDIYSNPESEVGDADGNLETLRADW